MYMYIFLRSTRHLSLALGLGGVRGPVWSRTIPAVRPEFLFRFPPRCPVPVRTKTWESACAGRVRVPAALCADGTGRLGTGRGKCYFSLSPPPVQGCPVADVTATSSACCDGHAAKHHPAVATSVFSPTGREQKATFHFDIFILLLVEMCSLTLSISCRSEPT